MKFIVIAPLKDEENTLDSMLESIRSQTLQPDLIVLINDGSIDKTPEIINNFSKENENVVTLHNRSQPRSTGGHVVRLIEQGLEEAEKKIPNWSVVLKIDGDVELLDKNHFEFMISKFIKYETLGIASGNVFYIKNENKVYESEYRWKTQGQAKFYRKECLDAMGGIKPFKGWDGIDDILAQSNGFITQKFFDFDILHRYETQTREAEGGVFAGVRREVIGYRNRAYPFYWFIFKSLKQIRSKPFLIRSIYFFLYSIYANIFIEHKLSVNEARLCRSFIRKRINNDFHYVD